MWLIENFQLTTLVTLIVFFHFIGDFILQSDRIAINKSTNIEVLGEHVIWYGMSFLLLGLRFVIITIILHFMVDYVTSKVTSYLWKKGERHWFFVTIGFDQLLHMVCLFGVFEYLADNNMIGF